MAVGTTFTNNVAVEYTKVSMGLVPKGKQYTMTTVKNAFVRSSAHRVHSGR
jgi:hypothetical protein